MRQPGGFTVPSFSPISSSLATEAAVEAVVIEAGFVGGGRTDRADLEPAQTIVLSRFGLEEVDHDSAGPPQAWKGRMILDHGYAQPDAPPHHKKGLEADLEGFHAPRLADTGPFIQA